MVEEKVKSDPTLEIYLEILVWEETAVLVSWPGTLKVLDICNLDLGKIIYSRDLNVNTVFLVSI